MHGLHPRLLAEELPVYPLRPRKQRGLHVGLPRRVLPFRTSSHTREGCHSIYLCMLPLELTRNRAALTDKHLNGVLLHGDGGEVTGCLHEVANVVRHLPHPVRKGEQQVPDTL